MRNFLAFPAVAARASLSPPSSNPKRIFKH